MYKYTWDEETGGLLLLPELSKFSKEPRPVYYKELDILGFDKYWNYPKDDHAPLLWAEANNYIYKGRTIAKVTGGALYTPPGLVVLDKDPEPGGKPLEFVDVPHMCEKNREIMEALVQETVQQVYQTYESYKSRIDVFMWLSAAARIVWWYWIWCSVLFRMRRLRWCLGIRIWNFPQH